jgi:hypothetical protein
MKSTKSNVFLNNKKQLIVVHKRGLKMAAEPSSRKTRKRESRLSPLGGTCKQDSAAFAY